jgi:hypothetical protein
MTAPAAVDATSVMLMNKGAGQTDDMFEIKADVPGVEKSNIKVRPSAWPG